MSKRLIMSEMGYSEDVIRKEEAFELAQQQTRMIEAQAQLTDQPPQLTDGTTPTQNAPAIRGKKLPAEEALKVPPVTRQELADMAARRRAQGGGNGQ